MVLGMCRAGLDVIREWRVRLAAVSSCRMCVRVLCAVCEIKITFELRKPKTLSCGRVMFAAATTRRFGGIPNRLLPL